MFRFLRNDQGMTLLGILLATALLLITAMPFWGGLKRGLEGTFSASRRTVAIKLASADLEKQLSLWRGAQNGIAPPKEELSRAKYPGFTIVREAVVEERPLNVQRVKLLRITVAVKWQERSKQEEIRLVSFLSK